MLEAVEGQQALDGGTGPPPPTLSQCDRAAGARQWCGAVSHRLYWSSSHTSDSDPGEVELQESDKSDKGGGMAGGRPL